MIEEWRVIENGRYAVSSMGRVRREAPGKGTRAGWMLKCAPSKVGYPLFAVSRGKFKYVHHAVAEAFIGPRPEGYEINHKNGIKTDNRVDNLEYVTGSQNRQHAVRLGLWKPAPVRGEAHCRAKLTDDIVRTIRTEASQGVTTRTLAERYGVSMSLVGQIRTRTIWKHVG